MEIISIDLEHQHQAKADVSRLLSACFYEPDKIFLEEDIFGQLQSAFVSIEPDYSADVEALNCSFSETNLEDLKLEYSRLFLGPFNILAIPYGSIYLDSKNTIMGESTMTLLTLYRQGGFQVAEDFPEMPDHIAVELEFLYLLNAQLADRVIAIEERSRLEELKRNLLQFHLGKWITPFTNSVINNAHQDFYKLLTNLTRKFIQNEQIDC